MGDLPPCKKIPLAPPSITYLSRGQDKSKYYPRPLISDMHTDKQYEKTLKLVQKHLDAKEGNKIGDQWKDAKAAFADYSQSMPQWNSEMQSQATIHQSKLNIGMKHYHDKGFYFPYSLDFRGRAYPIVPTFNHLGRDDMRCLMEFADKKPLGKQGFKLAEDSPSQFDGL